MADQDWAKNEGGEMSKNLMQFEQEDDRCLKKQILIWNMISG